MNKLVIDINGEPHDNDVLVFDKITGTWKCTGKFDYFKSISQQIRELNKKINLLNEELATAKNDISDVAEIVKGDLL